MISKRVWTGIQLRSKIRNIVAGKMVRSLEMRMMMQMEIISRIESVLPRNKELVRRRRFCLNIGRI